jgi:hypothetical protein
MRGEALLEREQIPDLRVLGVRVLRPGNQRLVDARLRVGFDAGEIEALLYGRRAWRRERGMGGDSIGRPSPESIAEISYLRTSIDVTVRLRWATATRSSAGYPVD